MPGYVPDPTDPTQPVESQFAETAAAEFRAIKAYIATLAGLTPGSNPYTGNMAVNGSFLFDQTGEGAAYGPIVGSVQCMDMFTASQSVGAGRFTVQRIIDALHPGEYRAKIACTTAEAVTPATARYFFTTCIEGVVCAENGLDQGLATAKRISISFEAECTIAGTFCFKLANNAGDRSYIIPFTIDLANTRQVIQLQNIPLDVAGVWLSDQGQIGLFATICLMSGTTQQGAASAWLAGNFDCTAGQTNFLSAVTNILYLGRLQIKQETACSPYIRPNIVDEFSKVQRYYFKTYPIGAVPGAIVGAGSIQWGNSAAGAYNNIQHILYETLRYPVTMCNAPALLGYSPASGVVNRFRDLQSAADTAGMSVSLNTNNKSTVLSAQATGLTTAPYFSGHVIANARLT